jgi:hypothetical protein
LPPSSTCSTVKDDKSKSKEQLEMPELPLPIHEYFEGNRGFDVDRMLAAFASDAIVRDEGDVHVGERSIRAWIEKATVSNAAVATPRTSTADGDRHEVEADVTGDFSGSPVELTFRFRVSDGAIAELEIG